MSDTLSGIDNGTVQYAFSKTGSLIPTNWLPVTGLFLDQGCTIPAPNGTTGIVYALIENVAFNQDSGTQNTIRFQCVDRANNLGTQSSAMVVPIDTIAPNDFTFISPLSWVQTQTPTVEFSVYAGDFGTSGLDLSQIYYAYSTSGSSTPSNWNEVSTIYTNIGCTVPATNGYAEHLYSNTQCSIQYGFGNPRYNPSIRA